jgi:hypothetical protein
MGSEILSDDGEETTDNHFEMSYNGEGVSISEYDLSGDHAVLVNEWWFTWTELFAELTGNTEVAPDIV